MNALEIRNALKEIAASIGPKAEVHISIDHGYRYTGGNFIDAVCYPNGLLGSHRIDRQGTDFADAINKLRSAVADEITKIRANRTREMAIKIISTTFDIGSCSDAALRGHGFSQSEIDTLGEAATEQANGMADSGPFSIIRRASNRPELVAAE